jgi:SCF ubiquitin ligase, SKP1 component
MPDILPIGSLLQTDPEGYLVKDCSVEKIDKPWMEAVEWTRQALSTHLGTDLHSAYLRGSVPRGEAQPGISDLDILAVTQRDPRELDLAWVAPAASEFKSKFPFAKYLDLEFVPLAKLLAEPGYLAKRFTIKVTAACIQGEDLAPRLKPFKPSRKIAFFFHGNIREVLQQTAAKLALTSNFQQIQQGCAWVMKRLVRTGFGLVMEKAGAYTRDLYPSYEIFSKYYPEKEKEMRQALEWAINPTTDKKAILKFLGEFGTWMAEESRRVW